MDELVRAAMARWPGVPACYGWLALDARGVWRMRDETAQARGLPGDPVRHAALIAFIERNYLSDAEGRWYFQNGPQCVYVELEIAPWVVRLHPAPAGGHGVDDAVRCLTTTGKPFAIDGCLCDEHGAVLVSGVPEGGTRSVAVLHDHDLDLFTAQARLREDGATGHAGLGEWRWEGRALPIETVTRASLAPRFGFVVSPAGAAVR